MSKENWVVGAIIKRMRYIIYKAYSDGLRYFPNSVVEGMIHERIENKVVIYERRVLSSIGLIKAKDRKYEDEEEGNE
jgi:hypothetical protein